MSKYLKETITDHYRQRLTGVHDALLVNVVGLNSGNSYLLRKELRGKGIHLLVVKNRLAARALAGTSLAALFEDVTGTSAVCWGADDIVGLAKEIARIRKTDKFPQFTVRGGVLDGQQLSAVQVEDVSKWPSRAEMLSIVAGQIMGPASRLASQLGASAANLASQIAQRGEAKADEVQAADAAAPAEAPAAG